MAGHTPGGATDRGMALLDLVAVMDQLRSAGGCPWDAEQTHQTLVEYLLEETFEVIEAIEDGTVADLTEELGDLLLQVVFHARIGQEESPSWDIDDVAAGITAKLVRRHPHVFADVEVGTTDELERQWHAQKVAEKKRESVLDGIPSGLPSLALTAKILHRARAAEIDVDADPVAKVRVVDLFVETAPNDLETDIGEILAAAASFARENGIDPETALRKANRRLRQRIRDQEVD